MSNLGLSPVFRAWQRRRRRYATVFFTGLALQCGGMAVDGAWLLLAGIVPTMLGAFLLDRTRTAP